MVLSVVLLVWGPRAASQEAKSAAQECKTPIAWAAAPPEKALYRYQVKGRASGIGYNARAEIQWISLPDHAYRLSYEIKMLWLPGRSQNSEGLWSASGLRPIRFSDQGKRTLVTVADWAKQTVKLPLADAEMTLQEGSQDKLSVWVQLGGWVACDPKAWSKIGRAHV